MSGRPPSKPGTSKARTGQCIRNLFHEANHQGRLSVLGEWIAYPYRVMTNFILSLITWHQHIGDRFTRSLGRCKGSQPMVSHINITGMEICLLKITISQTEANVKSGFVKKIKPKLLTIISAIQARSQVKLKTMNSNAKSLQTLQCLAFLDQCQFSSQAILPVWLCLSN